MSLISIFIILLAWVWASLSGKVPSYILPSIYDVMAVYFTDFEILIDSVSCTVTESILGLLIGAIFGFASAFVMDTFFVFRKILHPLLVVSQSIPIIAIAPLVVLTLGYGMMPKIVLTALCCFFPITVSLYDGFQSPDKQYFDLFKTMGAKKMQIFRFVKLPLSIPYFVSGLKIAVAYAMISALMSEWMGGNLGLGVYMIRAKNSYATDKLFAAVILTCVVSVSLAWAINAAGKVILRKLNFNAEEPANG